MTVNPRPQQRTAYVVRAGASDSSRRVYAGNSLREARNVARATPNATVTFRTDAAAAEYLRAR